MNEWRSLCRTCGTPINEELDSKLFEELNYPLLTIIEDITDMLIENDNTMPEYICIECKCILEKIADFRASCIATHKKLLAAIKKNITEKGRSILLQDNKEIDIIEDSSSNDSYIELQGAKTKSNNEIQADNVKATLSLNPRAKDQRLNQTKEKKKTKSRQTNKKTWICEQCGGEFRCSTYLKLHMLRHTGKKEFECDICKRKYYTRNEMQRHKILHSTARPYSCRFCDKSFRGTSSKAVHERTHTNERPFACQYCDKTFTSTSVRKMHERVHVNNRKYHCERCDQWFLRPSHLSLHQRTKVHKSKAKDGLG